MALDFSIIPGIMPALLVGTRLTVELAIIAVAIGLVIGSFVGIGRVGSNRMVRVVTGIYVDFIRGTPLLVQLFLVYFGLPSLIGRPVPPFIAAIAAMGINSGAVCSGDCESRYTVDRQRTNGSSKISRLDLCPVYAVYYLPQAFRRIIPPLGGNEFIANA